MATEQILTKDKILKLISDISTDENFESIANYLKAAVGETMTDYVMSHVDAAVAKTIEKRIEKHLKAHKESVERLAHLEAKQLLIAKEVGLLKVKIGGTVSNNVSPPAKQPSTFPSILPIIECCDIDDVPMLMNQKRLTRSGNLRTPSTPGPTPKLPKISTSPKIKKKTGPKPGMKAELKKLQEQLPLANKQKESHSDLIKYHAPDPTEGRVLVCPLTVQAKKINEKNVDEWSRIDARKVNNDAAQNQKKGTKTVPFSELALTNDFDRFQHDLIKESSSADISKINQQLEDDELDPLIRIANTYTKL